MLKRRQLLYRPLISTEPSFKAPVTFACAILGINNELAYQRIKDAWINNERLAFVTRLGKYYLEIDLPRKQLDVFTPFQGEYYSFIEIDLEKNATYYLPMSWAAAVISGVPYRENHCEYILAWFKNNGFVIRRLEELV